MIISIFLSIPLFKIIYNNIHKKSIIAITIVDLVYSDCIFFIFCYCLIFVIAVSACLVSETTSLSFSLALILSLASYFALCNILWSLAITGILRFTSIIKKSEQAGIQCLGPDYIAVWKIRMISIAATSILILSGHFFFNTFPAIFYTLCNEETTAKMYKLYWIPIILAMLANAVPKVYTSYFLTRQLFSGIPDRYVLSLEISLSLPFLIFLTFAFQFTSRIYRLLYFDPLLVMFG
jgi:hypothetical protein